MNVTERYVELLATEGYRPQVDEDDSTKIVFKVVGVQYRVLLDASDPDFVAVTLSYRVDPTHSLERLLSLANEFGRRIKVVKILVHPDGDVVRFSYETLYRGTLPPELLERVIFFLRSTSDEYFEEIRKADPQARA
jgi:hypothetical protein